MTELFPCLLVLPWRNHLRLSIAATSTFAGRRDLASEMWGGRNIATFLVATCGPQKHHSSNASGDCEKSTFYQQDGGHQT